MCNPQPQFTNLGSDRAEAFAERMIEVINHSGTALMISIGHRTRLFDTLHHLGAASSQRLATAADCSERYVREWLAALTVSGIVLYDPIEKAYRLPAEHAAFLCRSAAPDNLAVIAQYVSVLGAVESDIVNCFRHGGGVPYEAYERFHEVMAEDSGQVVDELLVAQVVPLVPGLAEQLAAGIEVLDLGCGAGRAMLRLAAEYPESRFTGYDLSAEAIARASAEAERSKLANVQFVVHDAAALAAVEAFDLITTFDAIHDQAEPARALAAIRRALKTTGIYLMQEITASSRLEQNLDHPLAPILYTISCMHCMSVSLAAGGEGLGAMWGEETALTMLADSDFGPVTVHRLAEDIQNSYYVAYPKA